MAWRVGHPLSRRQWRTTSLAVGAALIAAGMLMLRWPDDEQLPACDSERIREEVETLVAAERMPAVNGEGARAVRVEEIRQIEERTVQNILHERVCAAVAVIDGKRHRQRFQIVADTGTGSYRITPLSD